MEQSSHLREYNSLILDQELLAKDINEVNLPGMY